MQECKLNNNTDNFSIYFFSMSLIFILVNFLLSENLLELKSPQASFECGMENNILTRVPFSLQFFLVGLIFIVFDLEIIILLNFLTYSFNLLTFFMMMFFIIFVVLSLFYEWKFNKLLWFK